MKGDKSKFTRSEFRKTQATPVCLACMNSFKGELDEWTHHFCETCQSMKPEGKFTMTIRQRQFFRKSNCTDCSTQQRGGLREVTEAKNEISIQMSVSLLAAIHGDDKDGSPKKRRRYARRGQKLLDISQSVAAHGLKEAAGAGEDVSSSEDEKARVTCT